MSRVIALAKKTKTHCLTVGGPTPPQTIEKTIKCHQVGQKPLGSNASAYKVTAKTFGVKRLHLQGNRFHGWNSLHLGQIDTCGERGQHLVIVVVNFQPPRGDYTVAPPSRLSRTPPHLCPALMRTSEKNSSEVGSLPTPYTRTPVRSYAITFCNGAKPPLLMSKTKVSIVNS